MSEEEAVTADEVCASCGIAAVDDVTLKKCACDLVKYCSVACQKNHRPQHKKLCKKDWQSCMMIIYSPSQMKAIWESARFVACLCRLIHQNPRSCHAVANQFAMAVVMPIRNVSMKWVCIHDAHTVESLHQNRMKKQTSAV
jgi:hypothetical protein